MQTLPQLYSRRSDGAVQTWWIEIDADKFRVHSGILDGQIVTSEWTVAKPKNVGRSNETTAEEQAFSEATAKWTKKKSEKYSESVSTVDTERIYQCMLAKEYKDREKKIFDEMGLAKVTVFSQPKLDGIRCIANRDGLWSRKGKPITAVPHIWAAVAPLFEKDPELILDGELYANKLSKDFEKICSVVRKQTPNIEELEEAKQVEYHVYDIPSNIGTFAQRNMFLEGLLNGLNEHIKIVPTAYLTTKDTLDVLYQEYMEAGYEGQMVRLDAAYENKRSDKLLKRKEFIDGEFIIDGIFEGEGNKSGMAGYVTLASVDGSPLVGENGKQCKANVMGSFDYCRNLLENKDKVVGTKGTVVYFRLNKSGAPYLPRLKAIRDYE